MTLKLLIFYNENLVWKATQENTQYQFKFIKETQNEEGEESSHIRFLIEEEMVEIEKNIFYWKKTFQKAQR